MNKSLQNFTGAGNALTNPLLWAVFILYVIISGITIANHEMWGDEIHSWNIAKASISYSDLIRNTRFEGHPPVWYTILWTISKCTHNLGYVQAVHIIIASLSVFLILFFSPFSLITRILIPFGYFFLYEYAVLSRNYAIGVLLALSICIVIHKKLRYKYILYYTLLLLLTNTHLLALLLAGSFHLYFLLLHFEQNKNRKAIVLHSAMGLLAALPALYFIFPPSDSQLNIKFWVDRWNYHNLTAFIQAPLRSFLPVPAWWNASFWHTQFLIEAKNDYAIFKIINLLVAMLLLAAAFITVRKNKKSLVFFSTNFILSFLVAVIVFPMTSARYAGFLYIGFIAAYWFYCYEPPANAKNKWLINMLLVLQLAGGSYAATKDIQQPFSNAYKIKELIDEVPADAKIVTDYWAMNTVAAFTEQEMYCIDIEKKIRFIQWNSDLGEMMKKQYRYFDGVQHLFQREGINNVYMISTVSPEILMKVDAQLFTSFHVKLVDKREGAIEKGGNLYLYNISSN